MTERRTQNSILFLTTLGVYLGLVLVGATPVLGHAATTRNFELLDEIEFKDDLDKKPDGDTDPFSDSFRTYLRDLDNYFSDVRKVDEYLKSLSETDPDYFRNGEFNGTYRIDPEPVVKVPCYAVIDTATPFASKPGGTTILPALLNPFYSSGVIWSWDVGCRPNEGSDADIEFTGIEVSADQKQEFTYKLSIKLSSNQQATILYDNFERAFKRVDVEDLGSRQKVLWAHTKLTFSGDKVTVVTRLPRAALIPLLSNDAK